MDKLTKINNVIDYIETNIEKDIDLDTISASINYSKFYIHRLFKDTVGINIHEYVMRRKLTEAALKLVFSKMPIIDIASSAGYRMQQSFTLAFKEMYKTTPLVFRNEKEYYPLQLPYDFNNYYHILSGKLNNYRVETATESDIPAWMELVYLVIDGFPFLKEHEYITALKMSIRRKEAFLIKKYGIALGIMIFSKKTGCLDFFGIHPLFHKENIAQILLNHLKYHMLNNDIISITTFRKDDKADSGYREMLKSLGFMESELLVELGYPTQKFVLSKGSFPNEK